MKTHKPKITVGFIILAAVSFALFLVTAYAAAVRFNKEYLIINEKEPSALTQQYVLDGFLVFNQTPKGSSSINFLPSNGSARIGLEWTSFKAYEYLVLGTSFQYLNQKVRAELLTDSGKNNRIIKNIYLVDGKVIYEHSPLLSALIYSILLSFLPCIGLSAMTAYLFMTRQL